MTDNEVLESLAQIRRYCGSHGLNFVLTWDTSILLSIGEVIGFVAHFSRPGDPPVVRGVSLGAFERSTLPERARNLQTVLRDVTGREPGPEAVSELQRLLGRAAIKLLPVDQGLRNYQPGSIVALEVLVEAGHVVDVPKSFQGVLERSPDVAPDFGGEVATDGAPQAEAAPVAEPDPIPAAVLMAEGDRRQSQPWPLLSLSAAVVLLIAMIAAPGLGINLPRLFGPDAAILHGAVVVGLCIIGAAVLAVRLQGMLADRRDIESAGVSLVTARLEAARIHSSLGRREAASAGQEEEAGNGYASPGG